MVCAVAPQSAPAARRAAGGDRHLGRLGHQGFADHHGSLRAPGPELVADPARAVARRHRSQRVQEGPGRALGPRHPDIRDRHPVRLRLLQLRRHAADGGADDAGAAAGTHVRGAALGPKKRRNMI